MANPATVLQFPEYLMWAPKCSQCKTRMRLERVETGRGSDLLTYSCDKCGLVDRVESGVGVAASVGEPLT